jgi:hypothetical protein
MKTFRLSNNVNEYTVLVKGRNNISHFELAYLLQYMISDSLQSQKALFDLQALSRKSLLCETYKKEGQQILKENSMIGMAATHLPSRSLTCLMQQLEIRETQTWKEITRNFQLLHIAAYGTVGSASDPSASPDGRRIAFTGSTEGLPHTYIYMADIEQGIIEAIADGFYNNRLARWSPDGHFLAFLSDRTEKGVFHLYLVDMVSLDKVQPIGQLNGTAESISWSPCSTKIFLSMSRQEVDKTSGSNFDNIQWGSDPAFATKEFMPSQSQTTESELTNMWNGYLTAFFGIDVPEPGPPTDWPCTTVVVRTGYKHPQTPQQAT